MERYGLPPEVGFQTGHSGLLSNRPTLVLIHGAGGSSFSFLPQLRGLDRFLNILALELPGHGKSAGPARQSIDSYADWVHTTLAKTSLKSFFLGGHSLGGCVCLEMGLRYPEKIQGLILLATGAALRVSPLILTGLLEQSHQTIGKINQWCFAKGTDPRMIAQSIQLMEQTPISIIYDDFQACDRFNRKKEIGDLKLPTLILVGDQDKMTPPEVSRFLQDNIPASRMMVLPEAGHMIMLEKYQEVNQCLLEFIFPNNKPII